MTQITNTLPISRLQILLKNLTETPKPRTGQTRQAAYRMFANFCRAGTVELAVGKFASLDESTAEAVLERWKTKMAEDGKTANTINTVMASMNTLVRGLIKQKLVGWKEFKIRAVTVHANDRAIKITGHDDVQRMLAGIVGNEPIALRDRAILRCLWSYGLRRFEVAGMQLQNIDLETGKLRLSRKGRSDLVEIELPAKTMAAIKAWLAHHPTGSGHVFTTLQGRPLSGRSIYQIVTTAGNRVGITARPHAIRHGVATHLVTRCQRPIHEIQKLLGHRHITTTEIYAHVAKSTGDSLSRMVDDI